MQFPLLSPRVRWYGLDVLNEIVNSPLKLCALDVEWMCTNMGHEAVSASVVNSDLTIKFNSLMQPNGNKIKFSGTSIHGITITQAKRAPPREPILHTLHEILSNSIVIGHSIENDLKAINFHNVPISVYDISKCPHVRNALVERGAIGVHEERKVGLKQMSEALLHTIIQQENHSDLEDAMTTMKIFNWIQENLLLSYMNKSLLL